MKFTKKILSIIITCALFVPYTALAENIAISDTEAGIYSVGAELSYEPYHQHTDVSGFSLSSITSITDEEIKFLEFLADKFAERAETIPLSDNEGIAPIEPSRLETIYNDYMGYLIQYEHPELFYAFTSYLVNSTRSPEGTTHVMKPIYAMPEDWQSFIQSIRPKSPNESQENYNKYYTDQLNDFRTREDVRQHIDEAEDDISEEVDKIVSVAYGMSGDLQKILYVHDYIVSNYEYDTRVYDPEHIGEENRLLYEMVRDKTGVCQGYTYLFMTVMRKLGIECGSVPSDELAHIWNRVKLGDDWYNIDLTYDDPTEPPFSRAISHKYFLVDDDEIKNLDKQKTTVELFLINDGARPSELNHGNIYLNEDKQTYRIVDGDNVIIESGTLSVNEQGQYIISDENMSVLYQEKEESHHYTWNETYWDGKPIMTCEGEAFSSSPLHDIKGKTVYTGSKFLCFNSDNEICEIVFGDEDQTLNPIYTDTSLFTWNVYGDRTHYYPTIVSSFEAYHDKIYFNSPNAVYEFDPAELSTAPVYEYEKENPEKIDEAHTYFYGLHVKEDKLYAEYSEDTKNATPIYIKIVLPVPDPEITVSSDETLSVEISVPESRADEAAVYIAEYDDYGALIKLVPKAAEGDVTEFAPEDEAKTVKTFIWSKNNEPLAYAEYEIPKVTLKAENLDDAKTDISAGTLYFYPDGTAGASVKYEIDSEAEWYVNGVKLTDEVKGSYETVAEYACNEFIKGRYSTVTLRKTGGSLKYNKVVIDTHTTAVVYKVIADDDGVDISMRDPNINPMTGNFPEDTIDFMYVYNEKSEETSPADYTFTLNGKQIQPSELKKNDVLSIVYDETGDFEDSSFYNVTVSRKSQRGVIEEVNNGGKTVIFGGNTYAAAEGAFIDFETGDDCIFYFDAYGKIAYAELAEPEIPSIGILTDVHEDNGVYTAELIDNTGAKKTYSVRAANGEAYMDYFREFKDEEGNWIVNRSVAYPQLVVRYNIYGLELVIGERKLVATDSSGLYKASSERIYNIKLSDKTVIFDITGIDEDIDNYRVISVDDLVDETNYTGYAYDMRRYYNNKYMGLVITGASKPDTPDAS